MFSKSEDSFEPGVYSILPRPNKANGDYYASVNVYCLQGGWTVFQSRGQFGNPTDYFNKPWVEYQTGFGIPGTPMLLI